MSWKTPGEVRARTCGTKSPSQSETLRFIDSAKSPSTKIDGSLVNFRRRLSNRHGRPRRMLIWTFEGNTDWTVSTSTWFAQVGSSVLIELGQIAGSAKCMRGGGLTWVQQYYSTLKESSRQRARSAMSWKTLEARRFGAAGSSPDFSRVFHDMELLGLCLELSFNVLYCRTKANPPPLSNNWIVEMAVIRLLNMWLCQFQFFPIFFKDRLRQAEKIWKW